MKEVWRLTDDVWPTNQYISTLLNFDDFFFLGFWCDHQGAAAKTKRTARRILQVREDSCKRFYVVMRYIHVHSPNFSPLMRSKKLTLTIDHEYFVDPSCCSRISHATGLFITTRTSSSTSISSEPLPSPFLSTVFTLKQNRMDLNCFSIVYVTMDIDVHINVLFQTWWCHRQRQSGKQIHNCCKSGMLKSIIHWFCIKYSINVLGVDLN